MKILSLVVLIGLGLILFNLFYSFAAETITLTTFYPAPYGNYQTLYTQTLYSNLTYSNLTYTDALAVGRAYRDASLYDGLLAVSGRVGIGTTRPDLGSMDLWVNRSQNTAMRISSPITSNSALQLYDNNFAASPNPDIANSGWAILKAATSGDLIINRDDTQNSGSRRVTIARTTGNVGIGTFFVPTEKLDVLGNAKVSGNLNVGGGANTCTKMHYLFNSGYTECPQYTYIAFPSITNAVLEYPSGEFLCCKCIDNSGGGLCN